MNRALSAGHMYLHAPRALPEADTNRAVGAGLLRESGGRIAHARFVVAMTGSQGLRTSAACDVRIVKDLHFAEAPIVHLLESRLQR